MRLWDIEVNRKELNDRLWDIGVHRRELNELKDQQQKQQQLLGERQWDIEVHRKELNELHTLTMEHEQLLGQRLWDISVHRKELDEQKGQIRELQDKITEYDSLFFLKVMKKLHYLLRKIRHFGDRR